MAELTNTDTETKAGTGHYKMAGTAMLKPADYSVAPVAPPAPPAGNDTVTSDKQKVKVTRQTRGLPANRVGKIPVGLYPNVSRKKLGQALGMSISNASGILMGKSRVKIDVAIRMARLIGVPIEKLNADLERQRKAYRAAKQQGLTD